MNRKIGRWAAGIHLTTVLLFALCMLFDLRFGSYTVCMVMALSYVAMAAALQQECPADRRAAGCAGMAFAGMYAAIILLVYFAQVTAVRQLILDEQALQILDFSRSGLYFDYDLMGYGVLALSTFFMGLTLCPTDHEDLWLKRLLMIHGVFFLPCFLMPMLGVFPVSDGSFSIGGTIALECWCLYFLPIDALAVRHFRG